MCHCREIGCTHVDPVSPPGLSLTFHCRATLQNMPVGLGECRDQAEAAASEEQLMAWARSPSDWMLKAVSFDVRGTNSQAGPRKLLFTYKMCQTGALLPSAFKFTNQHEKIAKLIDVWQLIKNQEPSVVLKVPGAWLGLLNVEYISGKKKSLLSSAC